LTRLGGSGRAGIGDEPENPNLQTPSAFKQSVLEGEGLIADNLAVKSIGKPDAVNLHVRFDERDVETEHGEASEAPADERAGNR
jgi:hypothetical protein